jgi:hypothetical protein
MKIADKVRRSYPSIGSKGFQMLAAFRQVGCESGAIGDLLGSESTEEAPS